MSTDRAVARARIAERDLSAAAAERVVRVALYDLPVSLVARATTQLRRLFSDGGWSAEDDARLAATVGPGKGWYEEELDPDLTLEFGWRAGAFRTEIRFTPAAGDADSPTDDAATGTSDATASERTLGDTFEDAIVLELGVTPTELCFRIGPGAGTNAIFTRESAATDTRVAAAFRASPSLTRVAFSAGTLTATIDDAARWEGELLALFDAINTEFAPQRATPPDRQLERARSELGSLRADSPRDLARILDATTSPDAAFRRVAIERLDGADLVVALRPWTRSLDDSSRSVRRTTARELAGAALSETRDLLERALGDTDACVRYFAVCGLVAIGAEASMASVLQRRADPDIRVRLAVTAAQEGRPPA